MESQSNPANFPTTMAPPVPSSGSSAALGSLIPPPPSAPDALHSGLPSYSSSSFPSALGSNSGPNYSTVEEDARLSLILISFHSLLLFPHDHSLSSLSLVSEELKYSHVSPKRARQCHPANKAFQAEGLPALCSR